MQMRIALWRAVGYNRAKMSDDFYGDFDRACLPDAFNRERTSDYRSVFHQDRDRVMFTTAFRRLQAKTQVFQAGEYDFYRTRLTHSLEVANIAKSIAVWLRRSEPAAAVDPDLVEAVCLAHDIGHPPFGHAGERVLNALMEDYGGFEGNAQTLRILTRTIFSGSPGRRGMSPTRALLDGVLKYKRLHRDRKGDANHFIYDDQEPILEFCFGTRDLAAELSGVEPNKFHSLECQIMDHADDVAYSCFDIVDGAKARFLSAEKIEAWRADAKLDEAQRKYLDELLAMMAEKKLEPKMNHVIGELIQGASLVPASNFMSGRTRRHAWRLEVRPEAKSRIRLHKQLCRDLVFGSGALQQIEFKGGAILRALAGALFDNYLGARRGDGTCGEPAGKVLVPADVHAAVEAAQGEAARARLLCDHLAGMTDAYALRSYKRLFDPDYGSISELI
jgi:dGTPase